MARESFDRELSALRDKILSVGSAVGENLLRIEIALVQKNAKVAHELIAFDTWINERRIEIVMGSLTLIATQQPTGPDMRRLAASIEIAGELERIHDYVKGVGKICLLLGSSSIPSNLNTLIPHMAVITQEMLQLSLDAYSLGDAELARQIPARDDEVDELYKKVSRELAVLAAADMAGYEKVNLLQWAIHNLERSADRVTNICEWIVYMVTGKYVEMDSEVEAPVVLNG
jgi:phosphate transport system protein